MNNLIVNFYSGRQPDDRGRFLSEIQQWDARRLESVHDFIQWLFPLPEQSPVNPEAPVLDEATIRTFQESPELREPLVQSLRTMVAFYGFELMDGTPPVVRAAQDLTRAAWLTPGNHNFLRITRILRCTRVLGLPTYSEAFFDALAAVYATGAGQRAIGSVSFAYWRAAGTGK